MWLVLSLSFSRHGFAFADFALQAGLDVGDEPGDERCHEPEESAQEQREGKDEAARGTGGQGRGSWTGLPAAARPLEKIR